MRERRSKSLIYQIAMRLLVIGILSLLLPAASSCPGDRSDVRRAAAAFRPVQRTMPPATKTAEPAGPTRLDSLDPDAYMDAIDSIGAVLDSLGGYFHDSSSVNWNGYRYAARQLSCGTLGLSYYLDGRGRIVEIVEELRNYHALSLHAHYYFRSDSLLMVRCNEATSPIFSFPDAGTHEDSIVTFTENRLYFSEGKLLVAKQRRHHFMFADEWSERLLRRGRFHPYSVGNEVLEAIPINIEIYRRLLRDPKSVACDSLYSPFI